MNDIWMCENVTVKCIDLYKYFKLIWKYQLTMNQWVYFVHLISFHWSTCLPVCQNHTPNYFSLLFFFFSLQPSLEIESYNSQFVLYSSKLPINARSTVNLTILNLQFYEHAIGKFYLDTLKILSIMFSEFQNMNIFILLSLFLMTSFFWLWLSITFLIVYLAFSCECKKLQLLLLHTSYSSRIL